MVQLSGCNIQSLAWGRLRKCSHQTSGTSLKMPHDLLPTHGAGQASAPLSEAEREGTWAPHKDAFLTHLAPMKRMMSSQGARLSDQAIKKTYGKALGP